MGVLGRLFGIIRANTHESLDRVEDPEKMVNQYIRNMEIELENAQAAVVRQLTAERMAEKRFREASDKVSYFEGAAANALSAGNENLARQALEEKILWSEKKDVYLDELTTCQEGARELQAAYSKMQSECANLKHRRDMLVAKAQTAKAQKRMMKAMSHISVDSAAAGIQRMEEKIDRWEAEIGAMKSFSVSASVADELKVLSDNSKVEAELAQLKAKITTAS